MRRGAAFFAFAAAAVAAVALAGCSSLPSGSQVTFGKPQANPHPYDDPYVRLIPAGPENLSAPQQIVAGFLTASAAFDDNHQVARSYLATSSVQWQPGTSTIVYDDQKKLNFSVGQVNGSQVTVTVTGSELGQIESDGQYLAGAENLTETFRLQLNAKKQWRISQLPDGLVRYLLMSPDDMNRAFRPLDLYYFAPDGSVVVPNPVFIPVYNRQTLASQVVQQLLGGPTDWLRPAAVRTTFPVGTQLLGLSIQNGVATVNLSKQARRGDARAMLVQLLWTLQSGQLPEVQSVKLKIDGTPVNVAVDKAAYDPDAIVSAPSVPAYLRGPGGRLSSLPSGASKPLDTKPTAQVYHPSVSYSGTLVAYLDVTGHQLTVADLSSGATVVSKTVPGVFTPPSWDRYDTLWTVESDGGSSKLWTIPKGKQPALVPGWQLAHDVKAFRIARDGVRAAAIFADGKSSVQVGRIERGQNGPQADGFIPVSPQLDTATDLAWRDADDLAVIGSLQNPISVLVYDVPISGAPIAPIASLNAPFANPQTVAAAPGHPLLVGVGQAQGFGGAAEQVCRLSSDRFGPWASPCLPGSDPSYPG